MCIYSDSLFGYSPIEAKEFCEIEGCTESLSLQDVYKDL